MTFQHLTPEGDETPIQTAINRVDSFLELFAADDPDPSLVEAWDFITGWVRNVEDHGSEDLEWGEPGDCWDRIANDPDLRADLRNEGVVDSNLPVNEGGEDSDETTIEIAKRLGLGRHYGDPHCIWCLQGS